MAARRLTRACACVTRCARAQRERLLAPGATVLPCELLLHIAFVESDALLKANAVTQPVAGLDLSALNRLSHRTRAVRLRDVKHHILTKPCVAVRLPLDAAGGVAVSGGAEARRRQSNA